MSDGIRQRAAVLKNFSGGLNNFWDESTISNTEVPFLENLEFSTTGALASRPPIINTGATYPVSATHFNLLGYYVKENGDQLAVITSAGKTYVFDLATTWTKIWDFEASGMVQFKYQLILCRVDGAGAWWTATDGLTSIATMPAAQGLALHKERLFAFGPTGTATQSILYWSKVSGEVAGFPSYDHRYWDTTTDYTSIASGDGQWITGLISEQTSIVIFRNASTYGFSYNDLVGETGTVSKFRDKLGAENARCIAQYENNTLVLSGDQLYSYYNGNFTSLNDQKVRFEAASVSNKVDFAVSIVGSRVIVWFKGSVYVYQLKTNTWSMWKSTTGLAYAIQLPPQAGEIGDARIAYGISGSTTSSTWKLYSIYDHPHGGATAENFTCKLRTKIYDFETPSEWKRLYWWAADIMAANSATCRAIPVSLDSSQPSWDALGTYTWDQLGAGTWDNPTATPVSVTTVANIGYTYAQRVNLKLDHSLRFRRIYFELEVSCDGTAATTPVQIFSLSPMIGTKAKISGQVS